MTWRLAAPVGVADRNGFHVAEASLLKIVAAGVYTEEILAGHGQKLVADGLVFVVHLASPFGYVCLHHGLHSTERRCCRLLRMRKRFVTNCYQAGRALATEREPMNDALERAVPAIRA